MTSINDAWREDQRQHWMRHDAHRWIRPDAYRWIRADAARWLPPGLRNGGKAERADEHKYDETKLARLRASLDEIQIALADLKFHLTFRRLLRKYSPDQPRDELGRWTDSSGAGRVRLAAADKSSLGRSAMIAIVLEMANKLINAYRSENGLMDMFGSKVGTVAVTTFNGTQLYGSNSTAPSFTDEDDAAARKLREVLIEKYPDVMDADNVGRMPNNVVFHAEANVLMRAAKANGGSLAEQTLEVFVDNTMCNNCSSILPYVGLELGNPTVTYVDKSGKPRTMRNGSWQD